MLCFFFWNTLIFFFDYHLHINYLAACTHKSSKESESSLIRIERRAVQKEKTLHVCAKCGCLSFLITKELAAQ